MAEHQMHNRRQKVLFWAIDKVLVVVMEEEEKEEEIIETQ
jgi:hypothetical protein